MDPSRGARSSRSRCFPRTRGDGPQYQLLLRVADGFPPHSRGWTGRDLTGGAGGGVSPALAGMDPTWTGRSSTGGGFPRTRGDGPRALMTAIDVGSFPPHSRGWTVPLYPISRSNVVSPALAGMDRIPAEVRTGRRSFPRTRGDGPGRRVLGPVRPGFPPHSRGWTRGSVDRADGGAVSPALAGMDRGSVSAGFASRGFPRTRGDGPEGEINHEPREGFPPHSRGWTLEPFLFHGFTAVSPALAGMDPALIPPK